MKRNSFIRLILPLCLTLICTHGCDSSADVRNINAHEIIPVDEFPEEFCDESRLKKEIIIRGRMYEERMTCEEDTSETLKECIVEQAFGGDIVYISRKTIIWKRENPDGSWISEGELHGQQSNVYNGLYLVRGHIAHDALRVLLYSDWGDIKRLGFQPAALPVSIGSGLDNAYRSKAVVDADEIFYYLCPVQDSLISLKGHIRGRIETCTELSCPPGITGCNYCVGSPVLQGDELSIRLDGLDIHCEGNENGVLCPGISGDIPYTVTGRMGYGRGNGGGSIELFMEVDRYESKAGMTVSKDGAGHIIDGKYRGQRNTGENWAVGYWSDMICNKSFPCFSCMGEWYRFFPAGEVEWCTGSSRHCVEEADRIPSVQPYDRYSPDRCLKGTYRMIDDSTVELEF